MIRMILCANALHIFCIIAKPISQLLIIVGVIPLIVLPSLISNVLECYAYALSIISVSYIILYSTGLLLLAVLSTISL